MIRSGSDDDFLGGYFECYCTRYQHQFIVGIGGLQISEDNGVLADVVDIDGLTLLCKTQGSCEIFKGTETLGEIKFHIRCVTRIFHGLTGLGSNGDFLGDYFKCDNTGSSVVAFAGNGYRRGSDILVVGILHNVICAFQENVSFING